MSQADPMEVIARRIVAKRPSADVFATQRVLTTALSTDAEEMREELRQLDESGQHEAAKIMAVWTATEREVRARREP